MPTDKLTALDGIKLDDLSHQQRLPRRREQLVELGNFGELLTAGRASRNFACSLQCDRG